MTSSGLTFLKLNSSSVAYEDRIGVMYDNIIHSYFISTAFASVASTDVLRFTHNTSYPDKIIASFKDSPAKHLHCAEVVWHFLSLHKRNKQFCRAERLGAGKQQRLSFSSRLYPPAASRTRVYNVAVH